MKSKMFLITTIIVIALLFTFIQIKNKNNGNLLQHEEEEILLHESIQIPLANNMEEVDINKVSELIIKDNKNYKIKSIDLDLNKEANNNEGSITLYDETSKKEIHKKFKYDVLSLEEKVTSSKKEDKKAQKPIKETQESKKDKTKIEKDLSPKKELTNAKKENESKQPDKSKEEEVTYIWKEEKYGDIKTERLADPNRFQTDGEQVSQEGQYGIRSVEYKIIKQDGKVISESKTGETKNITNPKNKIITYGTKKKEAYIDHERTNILFNQINAYRKSKGIPAFIWSSRIAPYTQTRAKEISIRNDHWRPDGKYFYTGESYLAGEIITSAGYPKAEDAIRAWQNSQGHNNELLATDIEYAATAAYVDENGSIYWIMITTFLP